MHSFLSEDHVVDLVVGLEHVFGTEVADQALELHAHGGGAAATAGVFGLEYDHGVLAVHDDVAGADFLSDFHCILPGLGPLNAQARSPRDCRADACSAAECAVVAVPVDHSSLRKALDFTVFRE